MEKLEELANQLLEAKKKENLAEQERIEIEMKIAKLIEGPENASRTVPAGEFKLTVKRALNYKADVPGLVQGGFKDLLIPVPKTFKLDEKAYEKIRESDPQRFAKASAFVTVKPAKVSVTVKV